MILRRGLGCLGRGTISASTSSSRCACRRISSTSARPEEEKEELSPSEEASAFDELFADGGAFDSQEMTESPITRKPTSYQQRRSDTKVPRSVLGDFQARDESDELNKEWDTNPHSRVYVPSSSSHPRLHDRHSIANRDARNVAQGRMTPEEQRTFRSIFSSVFGNSSGSNRNVVDDGSFGGTLSGESSFSQFRDRNMSGRYAFGMRKPKNRYLSTVLSERLQGNELDSGEIEAKIDEAREEIVACQNSSEVWQWAAINVWGVPEDTSLTMAKQEDGVVQPLEISEKAEEPSKAEISSGAESTITISESSLEPKSQDEVKEIRFGIDTPYYAPVLLLLLDTLRERFRSPQSALAVIRVAKNLGPDSFVLGCSPRLYAEALRTRWTVLKDLQGARDTLREAQDTGILSKGGGAFSLARIAPRVTGPENEESAIRDVTKEIKQDVQKHIADGTKIINNSQSRPLAYEHQLQLLAEMDEMLGNDRARTFKPRIASKPRIDRL